jgi:ABC-type spermidine/putrescine transport system permease subunit II
MIAATGLSGARLLGLFAVAVYLLTYLPIVLVVLTSFNDAELTKLPIEHYSTRWYASLFENTKTLAALWTSIKLGLSSTIAATMLGLCAALAVVRYEFPGKKAFLALMTLPMLAPGIVLGVSMLLFARQIGFQTGFRALLLGHTLLALPYCTFIIISSLARFDRNLEDAARGLGAGEAQVLARITIPAIMPGIIGALLFGFTISIGEFVVSFFLTSAGTTTLPIRIYSIVRVGITPEINAVSTLILAATAVLTIAAIQLTWSRTNMKQGG